MPNMKNANPTEEDGEAWELARAFAEDTRNTHWPPKTYSCTFCRKDFTSAQALGGHMNVHRRDRARLHVQAQVCLLTSGPTSLFYQIANSSEGDVLPITTSSYDNEMQAEASHEVVTEPEHEKEAPIEELDLELRLGYAITTTVSSIVSVINFR